MIFNKLELQNGIVGSWLLETFFYGIFQKFDEALKTVGNGRKIGILRDNAEILVEFVLEYFFHYAKKFVRIFIKVSEISFILSSAMTCGFDLPRIN